MSSNAAPGVTQQIGETSHKDWLLVAGIPILEESHEKRYGKDPAYKEYKAQTSLLVPWPKAKTSA